MYHTGRKCEELPSVLKVVILQRSIHFRAMVPGMMFGVYLWYQVVSSEVQQYEVRGTTTVVLPL